MKLKKPRLCTLWVPGWVPHLRGRIDRLFGAAEMTCHGPSSCYLAGLVRRYESYLHQRAHYLMETTGDSRKALALAKRKAEEPLPPKPTFPDGEESLDAIRVFRAAYRDYTVKRQLREKASREAAELEAGLKAMEAAAAEEIAATRARVEAKLECYCAGAFCDTAAAEGLLETVEAAALDIRRSCRGQLCPLSEREVMA